MAFQSKDLSVLAYANNFTLWHYTTTDSAVTGTGYFNASVDMMRVNDLIIANIDTDGTPATAFYIVTGNTGSAVSVTAYA
ncbi:MAG: hypothetical protein AB7E85_01995 [Pseudobdellovibrionaceae bacterium]